MERIGSKPINDEIIEYLIDFLIQYYWLDENIPERARALFTSWCLMKNVIANTKKCDSTLLKLYNASGLKYIDMTYEDFKNFMISLIV